MTVCMVISLLEIPYLCMYVWFWPILTIKEEDTLQLTARTKMPVKEEEAPLDAQNVSKYCQR